MTGKEMWITGYRTPKRRQLFEFSDQPWLPGWLREAYLDCLNFTHHVFQPYYHLARPIADWAAQIGADTILDLGSGGAEHIAMLLEAGRGSPVRLPAFVVSDLYPMVETRRTLQDHLGANAFSIVERPLSALNMSEVKWRTWSIFTAFHHFAPSDAHTLLKTFTQKGDGLCIVELTKRRWLNLILNHISCGAVLCEKI
jgi:hypothetical protein